VFFVVAKKQISPTPFPPLPGRVQQHCDNNHRAGNHPLARLGGTVGSPNNEKNQRPNNTNCSCHFVFFVVAKNKSHPRRFHRCRAVSSSTATIITAPVITRLIDWVALLARPTVRRTSVPTTQTVRVISSFSW